MKLGLVVLAASLALLAGCGGSDEDGAAPGSASSGQQLFVDNCANCHALAAAGTSGKVGPDLDQLRPDASLVATQVSNGGGSMPAFKGKLDDGQIKAIADYVSANAGKS